MSMSPLKAYVEALPSKVMVLGGGAFGKWLGFDKVEPLWMGLVPL